MDAEVGSGEFLNDVIEEAWGIIEPILRDVADRYLESGYTMGHMPVTFAKIADQPTADALMIIANMIKQPYYRKDGVAYARRVLETLSQEGP